MLKLYGQMRSRMWRVVWFCHESNIAYEHVPVTINIADATAKESWYLKLNPNGRVPTIDDDGFVMWESLAIILYLARKYKGPLAPASLQAEGRAMQWGFFIANDVEPVMIPLFQHRYTLPPEKRNAAIADASEAKIKPGLQIMEDHLAAHPTLGLNGWDLADFLAASVLSTLWNVKYDFGAYPHVQAWLNASLQRPKAQEALKLRA